MHGRAVPRADVTVLAQRLPLRLAKRSPRRRELGRCCNSSTPEASSRLASLLLRADRLQRPCKQPGRPKCRSPGKPSSGVGDGGPSDVANPLARAVAAHECDCRRLARSASVNWRNDSCGSSSSVACGCGRSVRRESDSAEPWRQAPSSTLSTTSSSMWSIGSRSTRPAGWVQAIRALCAVRFARIGRRALGLSRELACRPLSTSSLGWTGLAGGNRHARLK